MDHVDHVPDYFHDITLPGFPGNKEYQKRQKREQEIFFKNLILAKKNSPGAKKICLSCFTPIYEVGGVCPNCDQDEYLD